MGDVDLIAGGIVLTRGRDHIPGGLGGGLMLRLMLLRVGGHGQYQAHRRGKTHNYRTRHASRHALIPELFRITANTSTKSRIAMVPSRPPSAGASCQRNAGTRISAVTPTDRRRMSIPAP